MTILKAVFKITLVLLGLSLILLFLPIDWLHPISMRIFGLAINSSDDVAILSLFGLSISIALLGCAYLFSFLGKEGEI